MIKSGFVLLSESHLDTAIFNKAKVVVWQQDEMLDRGGLIEHYTEGAVIINREKYLKAVCEFRIR